MCQCRYSNYILFCLDFDKSRFNAPHMVRKIEFLNLSRWGITCTIEMKVLSGSERNKSPCNKFEIEFYTKVRPPLHLYIRGDKSKEGLLATLC